jgi:hypothetical protein
VAGAWRPQKSRSVEPPLKRSPLAFEVERHAGVVIVEQGEGE